MEYDNTKYLVLKSYFKVKSYEIKKIGKTWIMYYDDDKGKSPIENSPPLYQKYSPTVT